MYKHKCISGSCTKYVKSNRLIPWNFKIVFIALSTSFFLGHYCFKLIAIFFNFNSTQRKFTETHNLLFLCTSWKRLAACHAGSQILRCRRFSGVFLLRKLLAGRSPHLLPATCAACFFSGEKCELRRKECVRQCADVSTKATAAARQLGASPAAANRQLDTQRPDC